MLNNTRQNFHHSKLPKIGDIGYLVKDHYVFGVNEPQYYRGKQKYQVIGFPLCDGANYKGHFFSYGIHTAFFQSLKDGSIHRLSGMYFENMIA
jgi:hypothetical protein